VATDPDYRKALAAWLTECLGERAEAADLELRRPGSGGWSNDTFIVSERRHPTPLAVLRQQPARLSMFPQYDLGRQVRFMAALGRLSTVPVPSILGEDLNGDWLGRPAFLMSFVPGRVPADDRPTFAEKGWLFDAAPEEQRAFFSSLLRAMARVNSVSPNVVGLEDLQDDSSDSVALQELRGLAGTWNFDRGRVSPALIERAFDALQESAPVQNPPVSLVWGDARPANVVCSMEGFEVVALLDWELAGFGSAELDIAWLLEMNWVRTVGVGVPPLNGFPGESASIAEYEQLLGRPLRNLTWYRQFAALRVAVLMYRYLRAMVQAGQLDPSHRVLNENVSTKRLATLVPTI
jgi:aminoglycoside phosphotransferase (APT) family kinase protein